MQITKLDQKAHYSVKGWAGIAFFIWGFPKRWEPYVGFELDEDGEEVEVELDEGEWVEQDETCGRVLVVMVGDDKKHEVDVEDLTQIEEEDFCPSCGQIGCGHGRL